MLFNSFAFMAFFPAVLLGCFLVPPRTRNLFLLIASYVFYMGWKPAYALLILAVTLSSYLAGLAMERYPERKKLFLGLNLLVSLGLLFVFKYFGFFTGIHLNLVLPVGISFYTFQSLGYSIDVYRGEIPAEKSILRYALFVSFFPQLVAGPIERSKNLLRQIDASERIVMADYPRMARGAVMMLWGYFLKMVVADRAAILVDTVFDQYYLFGRYELLLAAVLFSVQIYCDFASYSVIAAGAARMMGFELMENFNTPYLADSVRDFWRRWHISMGTWFRDYLYIPLGGSRKGRGRARLNLMVTFLVSGLWHGASWHYVAWGGLNGLYQIAEELTAGFFDRLYTRLRVRRDVFSFRFLRILKTFLLVQFSMIMFRAGSVLEALDIWKRVLFRANPWVLSDGSLYRLGLNRGEMDILLVSCGVLLAADLLKYCTGQNPDEFLEKQNLPFRWGALLALLFAVVVYGVYGPGFDANAFIYFQF